MRNPDELYEGVPDHLRRPLEHWIEGLFGWRSPGGMNDQFMATVASALRIPVAQTHQLGGIRSQILAASNRDQDLYLDCVDLCLHLTRGTDLASLKQALEVGGSAWTVNSAGDGLERLVDVTTKEASLRAMDAGDAASDELRAAWRAVYGRDQNPSDGWDHAIKAVEEVLIPLVVPNQQKPNLGGVAGELKANPSKWSFGLLANGERNNGETLEGMIRHIWPNPDRHGGAEKRAPMQAEAEGVLQLAITIVELCRGKFVKVL
jgi:hypothetical protein